MHEGQTHLDEKAQRAPRLDESSTT